MDLWVFPGSLCPAMIMVLARTRRWRYMRGASVVLLALMFVDISTNAFWWVRTVAAPITFKQGRQDDTPRPEAEQRPAGDYSGSLLVHRAVLDAETQYGNRLRELPQVALTTSARPLGYSQSPVTELLANGIVEIPTEELQTPTLSAFGAEQSKGEPAIGAPWLRPSARIIPSDLPSRRIVLESSSIRFFMIRRG